MSTTAEPTDEATALPPEPILEFVTPDDGDGNTETNRVDSRTLVRWCFGKGMLNLLEQCNFKNPHLVVIVRGPREVSDGEYSDTEWEDTAIYHGPLTAEMRYIYFHRPGVNEIRGIVVNWDSKHVRGWFQNQERMLKDRMRGFGYSSFRSILDDNGELAWHATKDGSDFGLYGNHYFTTGAREEVEVDAGLFAKPPKAWHKSLTARYYRGKAYDECDFRGRLTGSIIKAIIFSTMGSLTRVIGMAVGTVLGLRSLKWRALFQPLRPNFFGPLEGSGSTIWFTDRNGQASLSPLWLINPFVLLGVPAIVYGFCQIHETKIIDGVARNVPTINIGWWESVALCDISIVGLVLAISTLVGTAIGVAWILSKLSSSERISDSSFVQALRNRLEAISKCMQNAQQKHDARYQERVAQQKKQLQAEVAAMTCRAESRQVTIEALPPAKRTARLRASQIKVAVCRPFAH